MIINENFKNLRNFVIIRNLFFLLFKILLSIICVLFILTIALVAILSTKPRVIPFVNDYLIEKISKVDNINIDFDRSNTTLYLNSNLDLQYKTKNVVLKSNNNTFKVSDFVLNLNFTKLLFFKIDITSIILADGVVEVDLNKQQSNDTENFNYKDNIENLQKTTSKIFSKSFLIKNISLKDFDIILNDNNKKSYINILDSKLDMNLKSGNLAINEEAIFNVNKSNLNSNAKIVCKNKKAEKICKVNFSDINLSSYVEFFEKNNEVYDYLNNIKGYFNILLEFNLNKTFDFTNGNFLITSSTGNFYLKQFFDEKIDFTEMALNGNFANNFSEININSLNINFNETEFMMNLNFKKYEKYKDLNLYFDVKNLPFANLKQLWPNFLGQKEGVRPWVIQHIKGGTSPHATAKMNIKYFNVEDKNHNSGLQDVYSEVQLNKVLLDYNSYFPEISDINGLAIFKKTDMLVNIDSGKVLKSDINGGSVAINFVPKNKSVVIKANTKGPFADLIVHINKDDEKIIENNVNSIIEDYYTNSKLQLDIPIKDNVNFNTTEIIVDSVLVNKKNSLLKNSSSIPLTFVKPKNSDSFFGNINLTGSNIEYLPLNMYKPAKKELSFDYKADLKDNVVYINEFKPLADYISFDLKGFIDLENKKQEVNVENIKYNKSKYNVYCKSYTNDGKLYTNIDINGRNINYNNIINKIKNLEPNHNPSQNVNNQTIVNLNLNYLSFSNNKKLLTPIISIKLDNNIVSSLNFTADMGNKKYIEINLNNRKKMFNLKSNDFGKLFDIIDLTDSIENGEGEIDINQKNINGKSVIVGNLKLDKKFSILPNEDVKQDVLSDVEKDKGFKDLNKGLKKSKKITFDKLVGKFEYSDEILSFKEVVANSTFINLEILASGFMNLKTEQMDIKGLLVPLGFINGLFGANKLPLIGDLIFGQKDAGLFASKFTITKKDANDKTDIHIDKFSMILPGFLRNIFDRNN